MNRYPRNKFVNTNKIVFSRVGYFSETESMCGGRAIGISFMAATRPQFKQRDRSGFKCRWVKG